MFDKLTKKLTNNHKDVPLFYVTFDLNHFREHGEKGSCTAMLHPSIKDEHVKEQLNNLIDYIRENYDMEKFV